MPFNLKKLTERRVELMTQLENMVKNCETETRAFNEEEQTRYNEILAEVRSIDTTLDAADQGAALQQMERRAAGGQEEPRSQEELETRAFECYIRGIAPDVETRAATNMTVGDNGAVIPTSIANKIIEMVKEISPLYHLSTHYDVGGTLTIPSYDESTQKITMAYATEFTALTSSSGKFTSISLGGFLAGALTKISMSLINNSKFDIVSDVIRKMAEAVSEWLENELINGTDGKIEGVSKVTAAVTAAAATAITADELIDLQESIPDKLQPGCIWVMSRATRTAIRKLKDNQGQYLWQPALHEGGFDTLLGKRIYTYPYAAELSAGQKTVAFGDFNYYWIGDRLGITFKRLNERFAETGQIGFIASKRLDGKLILPEAIKVLQQKGTASSGT